MAMMHTGVSTSKALILVGAGLTGSIVLRSGKLSDLIIDLQELIKGVNNVDISGKYDTALLAAQVRQLAQEIRELAVTRPVNIFNNSESTGGLTSYIVPAAALGAMGYCYMWWKGWSFSDVMYVTKQNMAAAVANVSKQLEQVSSALALTKRHLSQKLEKLDWKIEEQKEITLGIMDEVKGVTSDLSQIGYDIEMIYQMVSGLEGKIDLLENKQDTTNSGLWYLCQLTGSVKDGVNATALQDITGKLPPGRSMLSLEDKSPKGLQFIADTKESTNVEKPKIISKENDSNDKPAKNGIIGKTRLHRTYSVGISLPKGILDI